MFKKSNLKLIFLIFVFSGFLQGCEFFNKLFAENAPTKSGRSVMFVGMDISGSFINSSYFDDSVDFLAHYLYIHLQGLGGADVPHSLYVGSIGGYKENEPKTFFPIQTFENKSIAEIKAKLHEIFPKNKVNSVTDFNSFFKQVAVFTQDNKLVMRPISIILVSDGIPDVPKKNGKYNYRSFNLAPLETLSRNVAVRLIYTSPSVAMAWKEQVPRQRIKVWAQDASVMVLWKDPKILLPDKDIKDQERFFSWVKELVDFNVKLRRVQ